MVLREERGGRSPAMDPRFAEFALNSSKCTKLSIEAKRELIYELTKCKQDAAGLLQSWGRKDILEVLCAEMGRERKYNNLAKYKLVELLLKIVSEKIIGNEDEGTYSTPPPAASVMAPKRPRKGDHPCRLPIKTDIFPPDRIIGDEFINNSIVCQNPVCCACLSRVCSSDNCSLGDSCGMPCHLECTTRIEKTGIAEGFLEAEPDGCLGSFCKKKENLLGCWRKQLVVAKQARRVDILCHRMSLAHKLLNGIGKYQKLHEIVDTAFRTLETEVGTTLDKLPSGVGCGIVSQLSCGDEIQKLCVLAIETLDSLHSDADPSAIKPTLPKTNFTPLFEIRNISSTSLTVVLWNEDCSPFLRKVTHYCLWYRTADTANYPIVPTFWSKKSAGKFVVQDLAAATKYLIKGTAFSNEKVVQSYEVTIKTAICRDSMKSLVWEHTPSRCGCPKSSHSDASGPSEGNESNSNTVCGDSGEDVNILRDDDVEYCMKPKDYEPLRPWDCKETTTFQQPTCDDTTKVDVAPVETPGCSASSLDEEPTVCNKAAGSRDLVKLNSMGELEKRLSITIGDEANALPTTNFESVLPNTPLKLESIEEATGMNDKAIQVTDGCETSPPRPERKFQVECPLSKGDATREMPIPKNVLEANYEYCVKVVRWLECQGHMETHFRVKFLTWFSLLATSQEQRVVSVFVDTLIDDPQNLAVQLVDTFSECIYSNKRLRDLPKVFCMKCLH